jgi:4-amino-4-deoxy-L-arabinose transferase-like glycosyltransferase
MTEARAKQAAPSTGGPRAAEPITRCELLLLAGLVSAGALLRLIAAAGSGVEHFDEGVYASNVYCGDLGGSYPNQRFYAPPLVPALIEYGMLAGLPPNVAALLPGLMAGTGTIAALWWLGRSWFAPRVGIAAAALAALSDFHVSHSASALTDVLLGLWMVLAIDALARSWLHGRILWAVSAGFFTGLAWWTKYNGWLPLAIGAAALPLLWWLAGRRQLPWWLAGLMAAAAVVALVWSPYYLSLQASGGYGPIAANHAPSISSVLPAGSIPPRGTSPASS